MRDEKLSSASDDGTIFEAYLNGKLIYDLVWQMIKMLYHITHITNIHNAWGKKLIIYMKMLVLIDVYCAILNSDIRGGLDILVYKNTICIFSGHSEVGVLIAFH